jgi:crotonobetaine/carnitine-CoA ligase
MHRLRLEASEDRVLGSLLRRQAEAIPDATYMMAGERHFSFGRVNEIANSYAEGLRRLGVEPGDRVALLMGSSAECVFVALAVSKLGAVWIPTNTDYRGQWLGTSLEDSRARVLVVDGDLLPRLAELGDRLPVEAIVVNGRADAELVGVPRIDMEELAASKPVEPPVRARFCDTAAVLWTSGTTGRPKGVLQSHNAWITGSESAVGSFRIGVGDVLYTCLPTYNSAAWISAVYPALLSGIPFGLDPRFSPKSYWDRTRFYGATHSFTLGAMHIFLWQAPPRPDDRDNPVRFASAIPMPERLVEPFKERFGIETILQAYGQSEAFTVLSRIDDGSVKFKPNTAGVPAPGFEVRLLDDDDVEVPVGAVGEICVRSDAPFTLFSGYFENPYATARALRNLWYHTGDLGRKDEEGQFFFVDRKADYIRYKGRSVSSFAIESAVNAHPAVAESAAYGVTSAELESEAEIKVEVVLHAGQTLEPQALARFVNQNAPYFFVPRYIEFVTELPHTPTGRVRKFELRGRGVTPQTWDREAAGFVVDR